MQQLRHVKNLPTPQASTSDENLVRFDRPYYYYSMKIVQVYVKALRAVTCIMKNYLTMTNIERCYLRQIKKEMAFESPL